MLGRDGRRILLAACVLAIGAAGCSRQAVVGSDPGNPAAEAATTEQMLRFELEQLARAQNDFFLQNGRYSDSLEEMRIAPPVGVRIDIIQGDRNGFSAIARTDEAECAVYSGNVRPPRTYTERADEVGCRS